MEFPVFRTELPTELELVQETIERKIAIHVLSNALIEAQNGRLVLSATNLSIGLRSHTIAAITNRGQ